MRKALSGTDSFTVDEGLDGLVLRAVVPVYAGRRIVGAVATEHRIGAEYFSQLAARIGLDVGVVARGRALTGSALAEDSRWLEKTADQVARGDGGTIALEGSSSTSCSGRLRCPTSRWPWR